MKINGKIAIFTRDISWGFLEEKYDKVSISYKFLRLIFLEKLIIQLNCSTPTLNEKKTLRINI